MFSRLVFKVDGDEIVFHSHELVQIAISLLEKEQGDEIPLIPPDQWDFIFDDIKDLGTFSHAAVQGVLDPILFMPAHIRGMTTPREWLYVARYLAKSHQENDLKGWWIVIADRLILVKNEEPDLFYVSDHGPLGDIISNVEEIAMDTPWTNPLFVLATLDIGKMRQKLVEGPQEQLEEFKAKFNDSVATDSLETLKTSHPDKTDDELIELRARFKDDRDFTESQWKKTDEDIKYIIQALVKKFCQLKYATLPNFNEEIYELFEDKEYADQLIRRVVIADLAKDINQGKHEALFRPVHSYGSREKGDTYHRFEQSIREYFKRDVETRLSPAQLAEEMRYVLSGGEIQEDSLAFLPNLAASWFVPEVVRNSSSMLTGLMLIDMIENGIELRDEYNENLYSWSFSLIHSQKDKKLRKVNDLYGAKTGIDRFGGSHPMAHRGSVRDSQEELKPHHRLSVVRQKEGSLIIHWLTEHFRQCGLTVPFHAIPANTKDQGMDPSPQYDEISLNDSNSKKLEAKNKDINKLQGTIRVKQKAKPGTVPSEQKGLVKAQNEQQILIKKQLIQKFLIEPLLKARLTCFDNLYRYNPEMMTAIFQNYNLVAGFLNIVGIEPRPLQHILEYLNLFDPEASQLIGFVDDKRTCFKPIPNSGVLLGRPGSCGFISLGTTRDALLKALDAPIKDNLEVRRPIGEQIYNDYRNYRMARDHLKLEQKQIDEDPRYALKLSDTHWKRLEELTHQYDLAEEKRNKTISDLRSIYNIAEHTSADELTAILMSLGDSEKQSLLLLQSVQNGCDTAKQALDTFLSREALIRDYLSNNIQEGWLGTYVALAWARAENRTLRIWQPKRAGSKEIILIQGFSHITAADKNPIDIIHRGAHYERLVVQAGSRLTGKPPKDHSELAEDSDESFSTSLTNSTILTGSLEDKKIYFKPIANDGVLLGRPGSCGFISLGTTRDALLNALEVPIKDNLEVRRPIGEQIYNDYRNYRMARDHLRLEQKQIDEDPRYALNLSDTHWKRLEELAHQYDLAEEKRNKSISDLRSIYNIEEHTSADELTAILMSLGDSEKQSLQLLQSAQNDCDNAKQALDDFLSSEALIRDYLNNNIQEGWLGTYVALAWARAENRTLRIWQPKKAGSKEIVLIQGLSHIAAADENPIDIIHRGAHYERLQHFTNPPIAEEVESEEIESENEKSEDDADSSLTSPSRVNSSLFPNSGTITMREYKNMTRLDTVVSYNFGLVRR